MFFVRNPQYEKWGPWIMLNYEKALREREVQLRSSIAIQRAVFANEKWLKEILGKLGVYPTRRLCNSWPMYFPEAKRMRTIG